MSGGICDAIGYSLNQFGSPAVSCDTDTETLITHEAAASTDNSKLHTSVETSDVFVQKLFRPKEVQSKINKQRQLQSLLDLQLAVTCQTGRSQHLALNKQRRKIRPNASKRFNISNKNAVDSSDRRNRLNREERSVPHSCLSSPNYE